MFYWCQDHESGILQLQVSSVSNELIPDHPEDCTQEMYVYVYMCV